MVSEDFKVGDLVWAKMKNYPPWPAKIENPPSDIKAPKNKKAHFVYFFGSKNFAWIHDENISPHSESFLNTLSKKKSGAYQNAVDDLIRYSKDTKKERQSPLKMKKKKIQNDNKDSQTEVPKIVNSVNKKHRKKVLTKSPLRTLKRSFCDINGGRSAYSPSKSRKINQYDDYSPVSKVHSLMADFSTWDSASQELYDKFFNGQNDVLDRKHVKPSHKRFGFIGLGQMGRAVVRNMIESGHHITVWNRNLYKCSEFVQLGAEEAQSPAELVIGCDVTFCCVSDPDASKALIFGERGILKGLEKAEELGLGRRSYVEMTSIDPETSLAISEAIGMKHGLYLEAPLYGTNEDAEEGTLLIVASGDRRVFAQCETCFHAIGKHAFYVTCEVGYSVKITLFLNMFSGTVCAAMAEALVLAERLNISKACFLDLLRFGTLSYNSILNQMEMIHLRDIAALTPVKHIQEDLNFALALADDFSQPMPVTSSANEVYKFARLLNFSDCAFNAVYKALQ